MIGGGLVAGAVRKAVAVGLLVVAASGCLTVGDEDGPILRVELFWDERTGSTSFRGGTCHSADVDTMDWSLRDERGSEVAGRDELCADRIDVGDMIPGEYSLEVTGYDQNEVPLWDVTCSGLLIGRFDAAWACDVQAD